MSQNDEQPQTSACPHPEAVGKRWGDSVSEERQTELGTLVERQRAWLAMPEAERGATAFARAFLTGADVSWLAEQSGPDEWAIVSNLHLEGANLEWAHLEGARLDDARLEGTKLNAAHLEGARLDAAHLPGANLTGAHLEGADLGLAHLEGASLGGAHLEGANLREAHLAAPTSVRRISRVRLLPRTTPIISTYGSGSRTSPLHCPLLICAKLCSMRLLFSRRPNLAMRSRGLREWPMCAGAGPISPS